MKAITTLLLLPVLFIPFSQSMAAKIHHGIGEADIINITPQQAREKARQLAFLDILQQVTGIQISSRQLIVNASLASYHVLQTRRARVINSQCDYHIIQSSERLTQVAQCRGQVQTFGQRAPHIQGALTALGNKESCDFSSTEFNSLTESQTLYQPQQRFCVLLSSQEDIYISVFALYSQQQKTKISRLFPEQDNALLKLKAGEISRLTPLSSEPLPGQTLAQEALLVLASREPHHGAALLTNSSGFSAQQTIENSVDMTQFDQALGKLDLDRIQILVLPYAVRR